MADSLESINRVMACHLHRNAVLVVNQQRQREAVSQIDGHRMQALKFAAESRPAPADSSRCLRATAMMF